MSSRPKPSVVVFAKDMDRLSEFYTAVIGMTQTHRDDHHTILEVDYFQLVIHAIPAMIAAGIQITVPPQVREDTPIKVSLPVDSIHAARIKAAEFGGGLGTQANEWEGPGFRACDGYDPEGNVFQVKENSAASG